MGKILTSKGDLKFYIFLGECALTLSFVQRIGILSLNSSDLLEIFKSFGWISSLMFDVAKIDRAVDELPL